MCKNEKKIFYEKVELEFGLVLISLASDSLNMYKKKANIKKKLYNEYLKVIFDVNMPNNKISDKKFKQLAKYIKMKEKEEKKGA